MFLVPFRRSIRSDVCGDLGSGLDALIGDLHGMVSGLMHGSPLSELFEGEVPRIDIQETDEAYLLTANMPGIELDKLEVSVANHTLTIGGENGSEPSEDAKEPEGYLWRERAYGAFRRTIKVPTNVDESRVRADYKSGVLTVHLPKKEGAEGRKIDIHVE